MSKQLIISGTGSANFYESYYPPMGNGGFQGTATSTAIYGVCPCAGTFSNLYMRLATAPGAGTSKTLLLWKNGSTTALTATVADTNTTANDTTHSFSVVAGDIILVARGSNVGSPAQSPVSWCFTFTPTVNGQCMYTGSSQGVQTNGFFAPVMLSHAGTATEAQHQCIVPCSGVFKSLYTSSTVAATGEAIIRLTLRVNGIDTPITCAISGGGTTANDTTHEVRVAAGDLVSYRIYNPTSLVHYLRYGIIFVPDQINSFILPGNSSRGIANSQPSASGISNISVTSNWNQLLNTTTEGLYQGATDAFTAQAMYWVLGTAPGTGKSYAFTLRQNAGDTALAVTISGTNTTGNITGGTVAIANTDLINIQSNPSATPAKTNIVYSILGLADDANSSSSSSSSSGNSQSSFSLSESSSSTSSLSTQSYSSSSKSSVSSSSSSSSTYKRSSSSSSSSSSSNSSSSSSKSSMSDEPSSESSSSSTYVKSSSSSSSSSAPTYTKVGYACVNVNNVERLWIPIYTRTT